MAEELLRTMLSHANGSTDPNEKAELLAKYGIALAQAGRIDECNKLLLELQESRIRSGSVALVIQIIIFEGVVLYYESRADRSLDRMIRAHALAKAARLLDLELQASVWLAHLSFNFDRTELLRPALEFSILNFESLDASLRARTCLVIADAAGILGLRESSYEWYALARMFARHIQDRSMLAAIEYNRLGIALSRIRIERNAGLAGDELGWREWLAELASLDRLQAGFGANALPELMLLAQSMLFQLDGKIAERRTALLGIAKSSGGAARCGISEDFLELEIAACDAEMPGGSVKSFDAEVWLDRISIFSSDEQFLALPIFEKVCLRLSLKYESSRVAELRKVANESVQRTIEQLHAAVGGCLSSLSSLQKLVGLRPRVRS